MHGQSIRAKFTAIIIIIYRYRLKISWAYMIALLKFYNLSTPFPKCIKLGVRLSVFFSSFKDFAYDYSLNMFVIE